MIIDASSFGSINDGGSNHTSAAEILKRAELWQNALEESLQVDRSFIGLSWPPSAEFFSVLLAIWRCGACAVLLDPGLKAAERQSISSFIPLSTVVCPSQEVWPCRAINAPSDIPGKFEATDVTPDAPSLALVTSGTTGTPKIVILSSGALRARIDSNIAAIGKHALSRTLQVLSLTFGHGLIGSALTTLVSGGTLIMPERSPRLAMKLGSLLDEHSVSFFTSVPAFWYMVLKASAPPKKETLQRVHVGSAPLNADLWRNISVWTGCPAYNCYGMTETANWVSWASSENGIRDGWVGKAVDGEFAVGDALDNLSASGTGEIWVKTAGLFSGYLGRPDLNSDVIHGCWFKTGDKGYLDETGSLTLLGRKKEEINRAGLKVQPNEVDQLLQSHPEIHEACTFGMPDEISGELVAVALVRKDNSSITEDELKKWFDQIARRELMPDCWFFVDSICRNNRGKLDRKKQRQLIIGSGAIK
jgi:acyl-CoA synthetase (AMP-forming)/AMP-acid ligase II